MFEGDMSENALNIYEEDAQDIYTPARILRLVKQVREHRKQLAAKDAQLKVVIALLKKRESQLISASKCGYQIDAIQDAIHGDLSKRYEDMMKDYLEGLNEETTEALRKIGAGDGR
jgi:hypothetical protein